MWAVEVEDLHKIYPGGVKALNGVSFKVSKGEVYSLLGPNGAGKTTTMKIIATLLKPTSGRAMVMGIDVTSNPDSVRKIIGYVPQDLSADDELTGIENVVLQARLYGIPKDKAVKRARELLEMVGLGEAANRLVKSYSGGMRRRLELAMGLVNEPELLILDEPTLGLDVQSKLSLWEHIERLKKEKKVTILMTTHYMDEADKLSDRIAIIDRGKIVAEGSPQELKAKVGGDVIMIKISSDPLKVVEKLRMIDGVRGVDVIEGNIRIKVNVAETMLPEILKVLGSVDGRIESISITRPTLDQVFIEYTGRMFRDEEPGDFRRQMMIWRRKR
ncbi:ABC transporter ATP-binding protein [Desulfurococcaceae archaeon AG1]|nr:MAG: ABC transporter ATP-binding protein [Desulfurococcaceae archaeon]GAY25230.1 ABC transporter ATP-binding protein [Desulfurococcaceae archaeon AG1]